MQARDLPLPPYELATRVGSLDQADDPWAFYDWLGATATEHLAAALPPGFDPRGKRILDFGCGAGRTLRHLIGTECGAEIWGCDIDAASIDWLAAHLSPPVHVFVNGDRPPLPQPDEFFDVIYCVSVFTHITSAWAEWLLELHRVLKPEGVLIATFMGEGQIGIIAGESWDERRIGMLVLRPAQSWDRGGPMVLHSPWWIREHWGRAFEVVRLEPHGFASEPGAGHGIVTLVKKNVLLTPEDLRRPAADVREALSLAHNVERLREELEQLRPEYERLESELAAAHEQTDDLRRRLERAEGVIRDLQDSASWRMTSPLRRMKRIVRPQVR